MQPGPDFEQIVRLADGLGASCCRSEDLYWESRLAAAVDRLLEDAEEAVLIAALDHLYAQRDRGYEVLVEMIESRSESRQSSGPHKGREAEGKDLVLFDAPLLAWSRYGIPSGPIPSSVLTNLRTHLQAHVFADGVLLGLSDFLYSPDQLPANYCEVSALTRAMGEQALQGRDLHLDPKQVPETISFISDTRHVLGVAVVPRGGALFRWQEEAVSGGREEVLQQWSRQAAEVLRPLLTGCVSELLLPQSYHAACRQADRLSRPYSVRASVAFLGATLDLSAHELRAVIAPFYDKELEEYRVGFTARNAAQVIHGVVWALLDTEDENADIPAQIESVLREAGVEDIIHVDHRLPVEYCDDCGTPLYPNPEGEPEHAELPEEQADIPPRHLH